MRPIPVEMRTRIVEDVEAGMTQCKVAEKWHVSAPLVSKIMKLHRTTGDIQPKKPTGGRKSKLIGRREEIQAYVKENKNATLADICHALKLNVSLVTLWKYLKKWKFSHKKKRCMQPSDSGLM